VSKAPKARQAVDTLIEQIRAAADVVDEVARDEAQAAEGFRFLIRVLCITGGMSVDLNAERPHFFRLDTEARKIGNSPTAEYDGATIRGDRTYRIRGRRGTVPYLGLCVYGMDNGRRRIVTNLSDEEIAFGPDGSFELILSADEPDVPGQWVKLDPDANSLQLRQYIFDREKEELASYEIEMLDEPARWGVTRDEDVVPGITGAMLGFSFMARLGTLVFPEARNNPNQFVQAEGAAMAHLLPTPDNRYVYLWYELGPDEALVIEGAPPDSRYWNLSLYNAWFEAPDYLTRPTSRTKVDTVLEPDGSFRFVVAHQDPGHSNWIDTRGHESGHLMFRWILTEDVPIPSTRVVRFSDLG
jgi:hypothetical protein